MTGGVRMTQEQFDAILARRAPKEEAYAQRQAKAAARSKSKYGNIKITINEVEFDSRAEARYWQHLQGRLEAGEIRELQRQVPFELAPSVVVGDRKRPALRYIADFVWIEVSTGQQVVADVKGAVTDSYRIKRHLMKSVNGVDILEIRS